MKSSIIQWFSKQYKDITFMLVGLIVVMLLVIGLSELFLYIDHYEQMNTPINQENR